MPRLGTALKRAAHPSADCWPSLAWTDFLQIVEQDPLGHASNRRGWIAIGCIGVVALLTQQRAEAGQLLAIGLPLWIHLFILLQVSLTVTAAWMARP